MNGLSKEEFDILDTKSNQKYPRYDVTLRQSKMYKNLISQHDESKINENNHETNNH